MISPQNEIERVSHEPGPDTLSALREMLLQDPRIGRDDAAPKEFYHAPSIAPPEPVAEPPIAIEPSPQQATSPSEEIAGDGSEEISSERSSVGRRVFHTVGNDLIVLVMVGVVFSLLFYGADKKKDIVRAWDMSLGWLSSVLRTDPSQSSDIAVQPVAKVTAEPATAELGSNAAAESVTTTAAGPVATAAAEPVTNVAAEPVTSAAAEPVAEAAAEPVAKAAAEPVTQTSGQKASPATTLVPQAPSIQSAPVSIATGLSSQSQHQFETMARDLAVVRRVVEQLAARQDQMAREIATLQAAKQPPASDQKVTQRHRRSSRGPRSFAARDKGDRDDYQQTVR